MRTRFLILAVILVGSTLTPLPASATPSCLGKRAKVVGTPGPDVIRVSRGAVISAGAGDDRVLGSANSVTICGDRGRDVIEVWGRSILVSGGGGGDRVVVGSPRDLEGANGIAGGNGRDFLVGGKGSDAMVGNGGADELRGGGGDDALRGGPGPDTLKGGGGHDLLIGDGSHDLLIGGAGHDYIEGRTDDDTLRGRGGHDVLVPGAGADKVFGNAGFDWISYERLRGAVEVDLQAGRVGGATMDRVSGIEGAEGTRHDDDISGSAAGEVLSGGKGNDILRGRDGDDLFGAEDGDDRIDGGSGSDVISFAGVRGYVYVNLGTGEARGQGSDSLSSVENVEGSPSGGHLVGDAAPNRLIGGNGPDRLSGAGGYDMLDGGEARDRIDGGDGDDWLHGGPEFDVLDGAAGIDTCLEGEDEENCEPAPSTPSAEGPEGDLPTLSSSVAYQADPSHSGVLKGVGVQAPLEQVWTRTLSGTVSHPIVADGRVFVTSGDLSSGRITALVAATGERAWELELEGGSALAAYSEGALFVQTREGRVTAVDPEDGSILWAKDLPFAGTFVSSPTAFDGIVYSVSSGLHGILYALDSDTGEVLWMRSPDKGDSGSPTLSSASVFISNTCSGTTAFDRLSGTRRWTYPPSCFWGSASPTVFDAGRAFSLPTGELLVVNASSGDLVHSWPTRVAPAADNGRTYRANRESALEARDAAGRTLWTFSEYQYLPVRVAAPPLVVDSQVFVRSSSGDLFVLAESDGRVLDRVGSSGSQGLGAGEGLLFVPDRSSLTAFR